MLSGSHRAWSHPGLNKAHRCTWQGQPHPRIDSWSLGKRKQEHRKGTRRGWPKQGPQILHVQALGAVSSCSSQTHPPASVSQKATPSTWVPDNHLCFLHVLCPWTSLCGVFLPGSLTSCHSSPISCPPGIWVEQFPCRKDSCVQLVPHQPASSPRPQCGPSKTRSWSSESMAITLRLVSGSPTLLFDPALLSPPDYVLHTPLSTLNFGHGGPCVVSWISCWFTPLYLRNSAQEWLPVGNHPHPIFIRPFGVEVFLLPAPVLPPTVPTTVKGVHLSSSPIRYKSTESRHILLFFLSTPEGSSMPGAHQSLTNICWMSKWEPAASSLQHKTKAPNRLVFRSPIFSTERTENALSGDRSSFHQPSPGTNAQWGERLMQQVAWGAGDPGLPSVSAGGPVESWALAWPPEVWVPLFSYRDNENPRSFLGGTSGKEPVCQCRRCKRCGFDPWLGKIPWRRAWQPTPAFLPGESHGQRSLGHKESDTTEAA